MSRLSDHIKEFEGCRLEAYKCPAGVWTIGYGHTGPDVRPGMEITQEQADELLYKDLAWVRAEIESSVKVPLTAAQQDALSSLIFNIGASNWRKSTVLKRINAGNMHGAADAITMWNKARVNGELTVLPGLVRRRESERAMFLEDLEAGPVEDMPQEVTGGEAKPLRKSKEASVAITGALATAGTIWTQAQEQVGPLLSWAGERAMWVLLGLFLFFLANRIWASRKGDR